MCVCMNQCIFWPLMPSCLLNIRLFLHCYSLVQAVLLMDLGYHVLISAIYSGLPSVYFPERFLSKHKFDHSTPRLFSGLPSLLEWRAKSFIRPLSPCLGCPGPSGFSLDGSYTVSSWFSYFSPLGIMSAPLPSTPALAHTVLSLELPHQPSISSGQCLVIYQLECHFLKELFLSSPQSRSGSFFKYFYGSLLIPIWIMHSSSVFLTRLQGLWEQEPYLFLKSPLPGAINTYWKNEWIYAIYSYVPSINLWT